MTKLRHSLLLSTYLQVTPLQINLYPKTCLWAPTFCFLGFFSRCFFIHAETFPLTPWLFFKAFDERYCLQLSGNKSWFYQQDILYPKACWHLQGSPLGPYGRISLYRSHADSSVHITFTHVFANSIFVASFCEAAVQYQPAHSFLCCWRT